jgi:hypothetical protein
MEKSDDEDGLAEYRLGATQAAIAFKAKFGATSSLNVQVF